MISAMHLKALPVGKSRAERNAPELTEFKARRRNRRRQDAQQRLTSHFRDFGKPKIPERLRFAGGTVWPMSESLAIKTLRNRAGIERAMRSPVPAAPAEPNVQRHQSDEIPPYACKRYYASCRRHPAF